MNAGTDDCLRNTPSPAHTLVGSSDGTCMTVHDLLELDKLGEGGGGRVSRVQHRETSQILAIKVTHRHFRAQRGAELFMNEILCMKLAQDHQVPCVAQLVAAFTDEIDRNYIVMELYAGDLGDILLSNDSFTFPPAALRIWTAQIVSAVKGLHRIGIIHRDLKPDNIFLTSRGQVRLGDFGLASIRRSPSRLFLTNFKFKHSFGQGQWKLKEPVGTPDYLAPEVLRGKRYGPAVDFWGLGMITFFLNFRYNPFADTYGTVHLVRVLKQTVTFPHYRKRADALLEDLILALLCKDPRYRLTQRIAEHPYFSSHPYLPPIDWAAIPSIEFPLPEYSLKRRSVAILNSTDPSITGAYPTPKPSVLSTAYSSVVWIDLDDLERSVRADFRATLDNPQDSRRSRCWSFLRRILRRRC